MNKIVIFILLILSFTSGWAQQKISGIVLNGQSREPVEGASIQVKNTTIGTTTDAKGLYELSVPEDAESLMFSCIGMVSREVPIEDKTIINVNLEPDIFRLDDVVITAIGIEKEEKALGYSVQELKGNEFMTVKNDNLINSMSGKVAGVQVTGSSGEAGSSAFIMIRGARSLQGNNQPLFVVDGIPVSNTYFAWPMWDVSNRIMDLNPADIEDVSILKGGAATALYGMRAANGVVLITTKKGTATDGKKINVDFQTSVTIDKVSRMPKLQNKYGQGHDGEWISGDASSWGPRLDTCSYSRHEADWTFPEFDVDGAIVGQHYPNATGEMVRTYDQYDILRTAVSTFNALNLSGGNENSSFQASASHTFTEGVFPENSWKRFTMKFSGETKISGNFSILGSASYFNTSGERLQSGRQMQTSGLMRGLLNTPPTFNNAAGYEFPDGSQRNYRHGEGFDNPYWSLHNDKMTDRINRFIGYTGFNWKLFSWINLDYKIGIDYFTDNWYSYYAIGSAMNPAGQVILYGYNERHINSDLMLNVNHEFNENWSVNFTLGNNMYEFYSYDQYSFGVGLNIPGYYSLNNSSNLFTGLNIGKYRNAAFYGDLDIAFKRMLYLTLTGRNEWSTTLPAYKNSFFYPSASLSWVFTELDPMKDSRILPFGKIRFSYAGIANDPLMYKTLTYYEQMLVWDRWGWGLRSPLLGISSFTLSNTLGNQKLKPEKTKSWEIGTDLKFIDNRITLSFTYFNNYSKDLLLYLPVTTSSGFYDMYTNAGEMSARGFEIILSGIAVQKGNWLWNSSVNFSTLKNVVEKLGPGTDMLIVNGDVTTWTDENGPLIGAREGDDYLSFYGYDWLRNEDGKVIINDDTESPQYGFPIANYDKLVNAGKITPDWILGWNNSLQWKNLSVTFLLEIKQGGLLFNGTKGNLYYSGTHADQESREPGDLVVFEGVKQSNGSPNDIQVVKDVNWYQGGGSTINGPSVPYIEDSGWIRLREIALSYCLGHDALGKSFIKSLEFYLSGRNLWLCTKYTGIDPETSAYGASNVQGYDYFNIPGTKGVTLGLKAGF